MIIRRIIAAALVAAAPPLAASADSCPTQADLETGIQLINAYGTHTLMRPLPGETPLTVVFTPHDTQYPPSTSVFQHALVPPAQPSDSGGLGFEFATSDAGINALDETGTWSSNVVALMDGDPIRTGTLTLTFLEHRAAQIGACAYDVWAVEQTLEYANGLQLRFELEYAPSLGIVVRNIARNDAGQVVADSGFTEITAD